MDAALSRSGAVLRFGLDVGQQVGGRPQEPGQHRLASQIQVRGVIGERHPRHDAGGRDVLAEDHIAGDARLVLAHVREQRPAVAVTDGI